jgi:hypothetical protein
MALRRRFNPWWIAPLLVLVSAVALGVQRAHVPTRADWAAATTYVREHLQPGDGVTWTPYVAGEGRLFFQGLPAFHLPEPEHADLGRYDRVWLLGAFGGTARDLEPSPPVLDRQAFGAVTVELLQPVGDRVVGDLFADLEHARVVRRRPDGTEKACDFWDGRGWHCDLEKSPDETRQCLGLPVARRLAMRRQDPDCGLDPWLNVSRDVRVIGDWPRRCVWFHPVNGVVTEIQWPGAPAARALALDYGFTDQVITDNDLPAPRVKPAKLTIRRGAAVLAEQPVAVEKGWHHLDVPLPDDTAMPLTFAIESPSNVDAHFCFDPTLRAPRAGAQP